MSKNPLILVTNDDGITAPGIRALVEIRPDLGGVVVWAPDRPQSGMGHAITINSPLYLREIKNNNFIICSSLTIIIGYLSIFYGYLSL